MLPLVGLAATLVPEIIRLIAGDKAGTIAGTVAQTVAQITGTNDPIAAKQKLESDVSVAVALQQKLAEIALEAAKAQNAELDQQRQDELAALRASIENTAGARSNLLSLANARSPIAYGSPAVSIIVTIGFFVILAYLIAYGLKSEDPNTVNIINIAVGVLGTAFATVVNFWLGSSSGSRSKDEQAVAVQQTHAAQTDKFLSALQGAHDTHLAAANSAVEAIKSIATSAVTTARPARQADVSTTPAPAGDDFDRCVEITLAQEGGFSQSEGDPGGATNFGITLQTLSEWLGHNITPEDVRNMTKAEAVEIYRANYWIPARCGDLPGGIDLMVFDFGVNAGPRTAIKCLQKAVGVTEDGSIGPRTLTAVHTANARDLIGTLSQLRLSYYRGLANFERFGRGWTNRTEQVTAAALSMV